MSTFSKLGMPFDIDAASLSKTRFSPMHILSCDSNIPSASISFRDPAREASLPSYSSTNVCFTA